MLAIAAYTSSRMPSLAEFHRGSMGGSHEKSESLLYSRCSCHIASSFQRPAKLVLRSQTGSVETGKDGRIAHSDGQPDCRGWTNATTNIRAAERARTKEFYTEQEAFALAKKGFLGERNVSTRSPHDFSQIWDGRYASNSRRICASLIVGRKDKFLP